MIMTSVINKNMNKNRILFAKAKQKRLDPEYEKYFRERYGDDTRKVERALAEVVRIVDEERRESKRGKRQARMGSVAAKLAGLRDVRLPKRSREAKKPEAERSHGKSRRVLASVAIAAALAGLGGDALSRAAGASDRAPAGVSQAAESGLDDGVSALTTDQVVPATREAAVTIATQAAEQDFMAAQAPRIAELRQVISGAPEVVAVDATTQSNEVIASDQPVDLGGFVQQFGPLAESVAAEYGVPASDILAQAYHESAMARQSGPSGLMLEANNFFGIKSTQGWLDKQAAAGVSYEDSVYVAKTKEYYSDTKLAELDGAGKRYELTGNVDEEGNKEIILYGAEFRKYGSAQEGFEALGTLFHNGYYDDALAAYAATGDPHDFVNNLDSYATDPDYFASVNALVDQIEPLLEQNPIVQAQTELNQIEQAKTDAVTAAAEEAAKTYDEGEAAEADEGAESPRDATPAETPTEEEVAAEARAVEEALAAEQQAEADRIAAEQAVAEQQRQNDISVVRDRVLGEVDSGAIHNTLSQAEAEQPGEKIEGATYLGAQEIKSGQWIRVYRVDGFATNPEFNSESTPGGTFYIPGADGQLVVNEKVAPLYVQLLKEMKMNGVDVQANSGFRSYSHQSALYEKWINDRENNSNAANPDAMSNHQWGLAVDLNVPGRDYVNANGGAVEQRYGLKVNTSGLPENWHFDIRGTQKY